MREAESSQQLALSRKLQDEIHFLELVKQLLLQFLVVFCSFSGG
jgi:hypothetical protein